MLLAFRDWPLRGKLLALLLAASVLPLAADTLFVSWNARDLLEANALGLLSARAEQLAVELDSFHRQNLERTSALGRVPAIVSACAAWSDDRAIDGSEVMGLLNAARRRDTHIRGLAVVDGKARVQAATEPELMGWSFHDRGYCLTASNGTPVVSDLFISEREVGSVPTLAYAAPVWDARERVKGVVITFLKASAFWAAVRSGNGRAGEGSFSVLYDQHGIRIAHSAEESRVFTPAGALSAGLVRNLAAERRFGDETTQLLGTVHAAPEEFERARSGEISHLFRTTPSGRPAQWAAGHRLITVPWTLFHAIPETSIHAPVQQLVRKTLMVAGLILTLALAAGAWLAGRIFQPIRGLTSAAEAITEGELEARVDVKTGDELGVLGGAFNEMAATMQAARSNLEERVEERTRALGRANAELEGQNRALEERSEEISRRQAVDAAHGRAMVELTARETLGQALAGAFREASELLGAVAAVAYRLEEDPSGTPVRLVPIAGWAATPESLSTPLPYGGLLAEVLDTGRPRALDRVPADVELRFEAGLAGGRARCITLSPLLMGARKLGVLAVGSLEPIPPQGMGLLAEIALPVGLTILRHEQSLRLAEQQRELELKNREVETANRMKTDFLANMSHELRTPLNAVIGFSDLLLDRESGPLEEDQRRMIDDIRASGKHLLSLINDLLDLAKIEAGRMTVSAADLRAQDVVADARVLVAPTARAKHVTIREAVDPELFVLAERGKLLQVLLNLLSNALKFSPERSEIEVRVEPESATAVRFSVTDRGSGMEPELLEQLFQPFVQGESALVKQHKGTGLGLAISKRLVELHGGTIEVLSRVGEGTSFVFTMPRGVMRAEARTDAGGGVETDGPPQEREAVVARSAREVEQGEGGAPAQPPASDLQPPGSSLRILVADDNELNRQLARRLLERLGYRVLLAIDGAAALEAARREMPSLILMDMAMPELDGFTVVRELKTDPQTAAIPVVALTALAMPSDEERARQAGCDEYLTKPLDRAALERTLARLLARPEPGG